MTIFSFAELDGIRVQATARGLAAKREPLLFGLRPSVQAALPGAAAGTPADALAQDIQELNQWAEIVDGEVPIVVWLRNASAYSIAPSAKTFFSQMAETAARRVSEQAPAPDLALQPTDSARTIVIPEKILFQSTLLPDEFITLASARARSVARLTIFQYDERQQRLTPGGKPAGVYGTGWMIGPRHLITNWHVVAARGAGEPPPSEDDLQCQIENMVIEFDYISDASQREPATATGLAHGNAALDYAVVRLSAPPGRQPLPLSTAAVELDAEHSIAANVIQHAGGAPRQFAIRNNLAATLRGNDLAYFTDTAGGSSGSPVCNDAWLVIALHKASTPRFGEFSFQGKQTAWVNVGTTIRAIIDDLSSNASSAWQEIGASVV